MLAGGVACSANPNWVLTPEAGSVPELKLVNRGVLPVLLVDGEELVGARQNRVLNLTILAAPLTTTVIPYSRV